MTTNLSSYIKQERIKHGLNYAELTHEIVALHYSILTAMLKLTDLYYPVERKGQI